MTKAESIRLLEGRIARLEAEREEVVAAIEALYEFTIEAPPRFTKAYGYERGDESAPFFSEAFLYVLLGKEEARTVLAKLHHVEAPLGLRDGRLCPR